VVSEISEVRIFCHRELVGEITAGLWIMEHASHLRGTVKGIGELTVLTPNSGRAAAAS